MRERCSRASALAKIGGNPKGGVHFAARFKDVRVDRDVRPDENVLLSYMRRNIAEIWGARKRARKDYKFPLQVTVLNFGRPVYTLFRGKRLSIRDSRKSICPLNFIRMPHVSLSPADPLHFY